MIDLKETKNTTVCYKLETGSQKILWQFGIKEELCSVIRVNHFSWLKLEQLTWI